MKLPAYSKYKASGVEWLGNVPEHWETRSLKRLSDVITVGVVVNPSSYVTDEGVPFLLGGDIREFRIDTSNCNNCSPQSSDGPLRKSRLDAGDLVVVRVGYPGVAAVVPPELAGANCASMMLVRRHNRFHSPWLAYLFNSQVGRDQIEIVQYGAAQKQFNISHAVDFEFPFPPLPEQTAIAEFLDRETGRMDRLVVKKRELIERLKEKRTALISRTVTRGLPPAAARAAGLSENPPLKPSGLDWLGDIPAHWEALTVRRRAKRIQTGGTPPTAEERYYEDGTVPWFGPGSFDDQIVVSQPVKLLNSSSVKEGVARMFTAGATMVVTIGATLGKVSSLTESGSCNQQITVIEFDLRRVHPRFATYQLKRLEPALRAIAPSATLPILDQGEISDIAFGVPPLPEQAAIAAYLDAETAKLDALVAKVETAIERLQEYRTALITAAVTGKIDVRNSIASAEDNQVCSELG